MKFSCHYLCHQVHCYGGRRGYSRYTLETTTAVVPLLMYEVDQIVKLKSKDK